MGFISWEIQVFIAFPILMATAPSMLPLDFVICLIVIVGAALFGLE